MLTELWKKMDSGSQAKNEGSFLSLVAAHHGRARSEESTDLFSAVLSRQLEEPADEPDELQACQTCQHVANFENLCRDLRRRSLAVRGGLLLGKLRPDRVQIRR